MGAAEEAIRRREQSNYEAIQRAEILAIGAEQEVEAQIKNLVPVVLGKWAAQGYPDGEMLTRVEPAQSKKFGRTRLRESEVAGFAIHWTHYDDLSDRRDGPTAFHASILYLLETGEMLSTRSYSDDYYKHTCAGGVDNAWHVGDYLPSAYISSTDTHSTERSQYRRELLANLTRRAQHDDWLQAGIITSS